MRNCFILLALFFRTIGFGQLKDTRAELNIYGIVNEISVSPDEKRIWLVTGLGRTYYTESIDSNWHYGKPLFKAKSSFDFSSTTFERISFFNKDTALLTGYMSSSKKPNAQSGYYLTQNAGKKWRLLDYGGDSWIYAIHTDKNGNAWMGGLSKELYYSNNFGQSWKTIKLPYESSDRTYDIDMSDSKSGVASSDNNEIIATEDNWGTIIRLTTPLDQEKYQPSEGSFADDRISKILKWNNYIVVNQSGNLFYSLASSIDWKPFPVPIVDFEIDIDSKKLFAVTNNLKVISFDTPTQFHALTDQQLSGFPIDLKVANHSLYVLCRGYSVYKVNEKEIIRSMLYTTDTKIQEPDIIKKGTKLTWGIHGSQLYLADDKQNKWYRENALEFNVADCMLLSDSVAILWDGIKNNYRYSLRDHSAKIHYPKNPIQSFLASPIQSFSIGSGSEGCFHSMRNEVKYERTSDSAFTTSNLYVDDYSKKGDSTFTNKISERALSVVLASINSYPAAMPSIKDFHILEEDKKNYLMLIDKQVEDMETDSSGKEENAYKDFYYAVPTVLDTLNTSIIATILDQQEGLTSTSSNWFTIQISNQNNDTINISRKYYVSTLPWNLPWKFNYKGLTFNCYNVEFSKFINTCIPSNFADKEVFDNKHLIMQIADYLYDKRK